jgi:hypothetical protein
MRCRYKAPPFEPLIFRWTLPQSSVSCHPWVDVAYAAFRHPDALS